MARLKDLYKAEIVPGMMEQFEYGNVMQVPSLEKIVVNIGMGEALQEPKTLDAAAGDIAKITGQKPVVTRARKSIANFRLREGMPVGVKVTLRGDKMYSFLDRVVNIALPRQRDFKGVSRTAFDGRGNYTLALREQLSFIEIEYDQIDKIRGMEITFVTSAQTDEEGRELLARLGMPFVEA